MSTEFLIYLVAVVLFGVAAYLSAGSSRVGWAAGAFLAAGHCAQVWPG